MLTSMAMVVISRNKDQRQVSLTSENVCLIATCDAAAKTVVGTG